MEKSVIKEFGVCPVCNGTGHKPCPDNLRVYGVKNGWYGYRASDDTVSCDNCGAQKMFGQATGKVPLRDNGEPCKHEYIGKTAGRSYSRYTCLHCNDQYEVDSGG